MTGHEYAHLVGRYVLHNFRDRGVSVYTQVLLGKSIIGKDRRVDLLVLTQQPSNALALECKFQETQGTADEKIPYALQDLRAMRSAACLVYAGTGFSTGILHMLRASDMAAYCLPPPSIARDDNTRELDHVLAMQFGWWDLIVDERRRLTLESV